MFLYPGKVTLRLKTQKPECPPKPPDLAQRVRSLLALAEDQQGQFAPEENTDVTQTMSIPPIQDNASSTVKPQDTSNTLNRSFDDLDIPYIDEDEDEDLTTA